MSKKPAPPAITAAAVENGSRMPFEHPSAIGLAALVAYEGKTSLAYRATGKRPPAIGSEVEVDGKRYLVLTASENRKPRTVTLQLAAIVEPEPE